MTGAPDNGSAGHSMRVWRDSNPRHTVPETVALIP